MSDAPHELRQRCGPRGEARYGAITTTAMNRAAAAKQANVKVCSGVPASCLHRRIRRSVAQLMVFQHDTEPLIDTSLGDPRVGKPSDLAGL